MTRSRFGLSQLCIGFLMIATFSLESFLAHAASSWLKNEPPKVPRGSIALVTYVGPSGVVPLKLTRGTTTFSFFQDDHGRYRALVGLPLATYGRRVPFTLFVAKHGHQERIAFSLPTRPKKFPLRSLHLIKRAKLDAKTLERIKRERRELLSVLKRTTPKKYWQGKFIKPVPGRVTSAFGVRRKINGTYTSVHHGVDFRAPMKTPVRAINSGKVVFAKKMVLSGLTIVIDHGLGLYSLYGHLSQSQASPGAFVKRGDVIGLSGNTGRSTGPHLHLGVTVSGIAVDPLSLIHLPL